MKLSKGLLEDLLYQFDLDGTYQVAPLGSGHINDTYLLTHDQLPSYVLQRLNQQVFEDPVAVMTNLELIRETLQSEVGVSTHQINFLTYLKSRQGEPFFSDETTGFWRVNPYIEGIHTVEFADRPEMAFHTASGFGHFVAALSGLDAGNLKVTIPHFHHAPLRLVQFEKALKADILGRSKGIEELVEWVAEQSRWVSYYSELVQSGTLPLRVVHNDTKINNLLFNDHDEVAGVIDLDTVMPGYIIYDFGDMVRTVVSSAGEDETDLSRVEVRMPFFKALTEGYLNSMKGHITTAECDQLVFSGKLMTYIQGIRFLTDYLEGDHYYQKISRPTQNLERARNQFKLLASIIANEAEMEHMVRQIS